MSDVFVSYKAEDRRRVQPLVAALESEGLSVWWDVQIGAGAAWRHSIEAEIIAAKCVIVVWSKRSVGPEGSFVRDEASRAMERDTYLPVKIDTSRPPLGFGETQALLLSGWKGDRADTRYQAVLASVRAIIERKPLPAFAFDAGAKNVSRRAVVATGAIAGAAAAGVGSWLFLKPRRSNAADSIAVLPFANLSGDPAQAYFSDGIAEEMRNTLSRISQLKVVARVSSEAVREDDARTAATKLGVATILTGSVRRSPSTIRVSAELIDGKTGLQRWSQTFERPTGDALALQTSIAETLAEALSIELSGSDKAALALGGTKNIVAHDLLLRADPTQSDDTQEALQRAIASVDAAIELDPNYANAYARKSYALRYYAITFVRDPADRAQMLKEAEAAARRAIAIAPRLAEGHAALASMLKLRLQFRAALSELERANALPGSNVLARRDYAIYLAQLSRPEKAWEVAVKATALDPLSPGAYEGNAVVLFLSHRFSEAISAARRSIQLAEKRTWVRGVAGDSLLMLRRFDEAQSEFDKMPQSDIRALTGRAAVAALTGHRAASNGILSDIESNYGTSAHYRLAEVFAIRKENDVAIDHLHKAVSSQSPGLASIKVDPFLDPIRGDPRLAEIIRKLDFPS